MARSSSVWQFCEWLSQMAGMVHEPAIRYAWHVGNMLGDAGARGRGGSRVRRAIPRVPGAIAASAYKPPLLMAHPHY